MIIGTRILYPEEVQRWHRAELFQISVYNGMEDNLRIMEECVHACRETGKPYVIHPVRFSLLKKRTYEKVRTMARFSDYTMILHDERTDGNGRIGKTDQSAVSAALNDLRAMTNISIENSTHTGDVQWFWDTYADSITLDIGHVESFGLDSVKFVRALDAATAGRVEFVHMHRNNGLHGGITDHWPLKKGCRELAALETLLPRCPDVSVILEINEIDEVNDSLDLLRALREQITKGE